MYDYDMKVPNFMFCGGHEHKTTSFFFSWTLIQSFYNEIPEVFANIWWTERDGISTIKFEAARIHFESDVFMKVAVVVAKAPY